MRQFTDSLPRCIARVAHCRKVARLCHTRPQAAYACRIFHETVRQHSEHSRTFHQIEESERNVEGRAGGCAGQDHARDTRRHCTMGWQLAVCTIFTPPSRIDSQGRRLSTWRLPVPQCGQLQGACSSSLRTLHVFARPRLASWAYTCFFTTNRRHAPCQSPEHNCRNRISERLVDRTSSDQGEHRQPSSGFRTAWRYLANVPFLGSRNGSHPVFELGFGASVTQEAGERGFPRIDDSNFGRRWSTVVAEIRRYF
jgi:hypothetical protein